MIYYNPNTNQRYSEDNLPNNTDELVELVLNYPEYDEFTQTLDEDDIRIIDGKYTLNFKVVDLPQEVVNQNLLHKEEVINKYKTYLLNNIRKERNKRLAETDYLLMIDYPISEDKLVEVKEYRQALRDFPQQEGAPWLNQEIPWPINPIN